MWIATDIGFYSAVAHRDQADTVMVRARSRADLLALLEFGRDVLADHPQAAEIGPLVDSPPPADYPARVTMPAVVWADLLAALAVRIKYDNFKTRVGNVNRERAATYGRVWQALVAIEREPGATAWSSIGRSTMGSGPAKGAATRSTSTTAASTTPTGCCSARCARRSGRATDLRSDSQSVAQAATL